jgi:competence protein ComEC
MKRPLTGLVVTYASGIWIGSLCQWPFHWFAVAAAVLLLVFFCLYRTRWSLAPLLGLACVIGALHDRAATSNHSPLHIARLLDRRDQNVLLRGTIISDTGYREEMAEPSRLSFKLRLAALWLNGQWQPAEGKLMMFISDTRKPATLKYGDAIECSAILRVPPPARNPGTFDWRAWLARQDIQFTATIRKSDSCTVTATNGGNWLTALSLRLRERFERALRLGLDKEPGLAGVLAGMVIGQRSEIPPDTYADFQHTGVFHVFAINGLHVGLATAVVLICLRVARVPRRWCGVAAIPLLTLYVFATGAHPGAVRALVMASVWLIGWMLVRPTDALSNLAAAALVILAWDPTQLFDGGFVLSFTVVLALVTLTPRIEEKLGSWVAPDPLRPRSHRPNWVVLTERPAHWCLRLFSGSLAAWVGLLPLMAVYFHLFTPISVLANLVVIPLLGFIIALGMLSMLAHSIWPWLTLTFNNANFFLLSTMVRVVDGLGRVPLGHHFVQAPPLWLICVYYGLGFLLLSRRIAWARRRLAAAVTVPTLGLALLVAGVREEVVQLTVLDLTDGVAVFLNGPGERNDVLIDGGGDWSGPHVVLPFLRAQGVDRLAALVLTRGDKAHAAGLSAVARQVPTAEAWQSAAGSRSKFYAQWLEDLQALKISRAILWAGDERNLSNGVRVRVLHPPRRALSTRSDDNALVLAVEYGPTRVLLMSDVGQTIERRLVESGEDLRAQIIVKGQHGKEPSCTDQLLNAVEPAAVVASVGTRPSTRYLQPDLRERLEHRGVPLLRTDETGAVTIRMTRRGYRIQGFLAP